MQGTVNITIAQYHEFLDYKKACEEKAVFIQDYNRYDHYSYRRFVTEDAAVIELTEKISELKNEIKSKHDHIYCLTCELQKEKESKVVKKKSFFNWFK